MFRKRSTQRELFGATFPQNKAFRRRPNPSKREVHTAARTPRERKSSGGAPSKGGARAALPQCSGSAPAKGLPKPLKRGSARAALPQKGSARVALPQKRSVMVALPRKGSVRAALSRRGHPKPSKREASWRRPLERGANGRRSHLRRWRSRGAATDRAARRQRQNHPCGRCSRHDSRSAALAASHVLRRASVQPGEPPVTGIAHASPPGKPPRVEATPAPSPSPGQGEVKAARRRQHSTAGSAARHGRAGDSHSSPR